MTKRIDVRELDPTALAEFIRDTVNATLVNGTGITITPDDPGDTITISATGGGGGGAATYSGVHCTKSAAQSIPNGTATALTWDTEVHDTDAYHSTAANTSRFTAPTTGYYVLRASAAWGSTGTANQNRELSVRKNGVATELARIIIDTGPAGNSPAYPLVTPPLLLAAGDYLEVYARQASVASLNVLSNADLTWASLQRIGA